MAAPAGRLWRPFGRAQAIAALLAAAASGPAAARQDRPNMLPTRHVAVTYSMVGGSPGQSEATRVVYGPQDPARFHRPDGYRVEQFPAELLEALPDW